MGPPAKKSKKKTGESSTAARSRAAPQSALVGATATPSQSRPQSAQGAVPQVVERSDEHVRPQASPPSPDAAPSEVHPSQQSEVNERPPPASADPRNIAQAGSTRVGPTSRNKVMAKKRKAGPETGAGPSETVDDVHAQRERKSRRIRPAGDDEGESDETPSQSTQGPAETEIVSEEEAQRRAYKKENGRWIVNPDTLPFDASIIPSKLFEDVEVKKSGKRSKEANTQLKLKAEAAANKGFRRNSSYMYIFGRGTYFELDVKDMVNAREDSGVIFRPLEREGINHVLSRMVKLNFNKQILTVKPDTRNRPTCWRECWEAGPFIIINGQHSWAAAKEILSGETTVDDTAVVNHVRKWTCEVVWTDINEHLHALSCKCNDGNVDDPFLSSLSKTIILCRHLWDNAHRPPHVRKNSGKKSNASPEDIKRYNVSAPHVKFGPRGPNLARL